MSAGINHQAVDVLVVDCDGDFYRVAYGLVFPGVKVHVLSDAVGTRWEEGFGGTNVVLGGDRGCASGVSPGFLEEEDEGVCVEVCFVDD